MELAILGMRIRASIRGWVSAKIERAVAYLIAWAFSYAKVQQMFVAQIACSTPIGSALNQHIEDQAERLVENMIEDAQHNLVVEADNVEGLERYINDAVDDAINDLEITTEQIGRFENLVADVVLRSDVADELVSRTSEQMLEFLIAQKARWKTLHHAHTTAGAADLSDNDIFEYQQLHRLFG